MYTPRLEGRSHLPTSDRLEFFARLYPALRTRREITENAPSSCMNSSGVTLCNRHPVGEMVWCQAIRLTPFLAAKPPGKIRSDFIKFIAGEKLGGLESAASCAIGRLQNKFTR